MSCSAHKILIDLGPIYRRFEHRLDVLEDVFTNWVSYAPPSLHIKEVMFLEGLLSAVWQHWSLFCRRVVFSSALGCTTKSGALIGCCVTPATWERVSYISCRAHSGGAIQVGQVNSVLRKEPTWGDVQKIQSIITTIGPQNNQHLISCFGSVSRGPLHVQIVRNASAHRNFQTLQNVKNLSPYYNVHPIQHPAETLRWEEPNSRDFAFMDWIDEMRIIADLVTN